MKSKTFFASCVVAATIAFSVPAQAYDPVIDDTPSSEAMVFDLFIARPLGLVGTIVGTAVYVVALPINLLSMNLEDPAQRLIIEPLEFTFVRDLGDLD